MSWCRLDFIEGRPLFLANWPACTIRSRAYQLLHWPSCTVSVEGSAFCSITFSPHQDNRLDNTVCEDNDARVGRNEVSHNGKDSALDCVTRDR